MAMVVATPTAFSHRSLILQSQAHPRTSFNSFNFNPSYNYSNGYLKSFSNAQRIGSFRRRRRFKQAWHSHQDRIEEEKPGREAKTDDDEDVQNLGVELALILLRFYRREISPLLPSSCRYVPSCSEYAMQAYKRYGVVRGTVLTTWRLCRCNPLAYNFKWKGLKEDVLRHVRDCCNHYPYQIRNGKAFARTSS